MNHAVDVMLGEDLAQLCLIADIALDKGHLDARDCLDALENNGRGIAEVVVGNGLMTSFDELDDCMAPDEARSTRYKNLHCSPHQFTLQKQDSR